MGRLVAINVPLSSVFTSRFSCVLVLVMVTAQFGTDAPDGSVTKPEIWPTLLWACAAGNMKQRAGTAMSQARV